ncbi:hypothetical protein CapIbe_003603 [Capra ibex]
MSTEGSGRVAEKALSGIPVSGGTAVTMMDKVFAHMECSFQGTKRAQGAGQGEPTCQPGWNKRDKHLAIPVVAPWGFGDS